MKWGSARVHRGMVAELAQAQLRLHPQAVLRMRGGSCTARGAAATGAVGRTVAIAWSHASERGDMALLLPPRVRMQLSLERVGRLSPRSRANRKMPQL